MKRPGVKERIIATASRLFYEEGYNQTGINQIIEEADVAKASMYKHFRSKEDIAVAYLQRRHALWTQNMLAHVAAQNTPKARVIGCFDYLVDWLGTVGYRGCSWQNIITDLPADHHKIPEQARLHKNELRAWLIQQLQSEGTYGETRAKDLGDQVMVLIEGAIILTQIEKDVWPVRSAKKACITLLG